MKKYLLVALLAMGATAFGARQGTADTVDLPIHTKGELVAATSNLVIEATTNGMSANAMEFDFGQLPIPAESADNSTDKTYTGVGAGTFKVTRGDNTALLDEVTYDTFKVGIGKNETEAVGGDAKVETKGTPKKGVTVNYTLSGSGTVGTADTYYEGAVLATVTVSNKTGDNTTAGSFLDTANKVYVKVTKS